MKELKFINYNWNIEKNRELKKQRNISFEEIVIAMKDNYIIDIEDHPNKEKYSNQFLMYIYLPQHDYVFIVPFVEDYEKKEIFFKTIFPTRKFNKKFKEIIKRRFKDEI